MCLFSIHLKTSGLISNDEEGASDFQTSFHLKIDLVSSERLNKSRTEPTILSILFIPPAFMPTGI